MVKVNVEGVGMAMRRNNGRSPDVHQLIVRALTDEEFRQELLYGDREQLLKDDYPGLSRHERVAVMRVQADDIYQFAARLKDLLDR